MMQRDKKTVLFVCTGNTCRSPMAMALFNRMVKDGKINEFVAESAGIAATGEKISQNAAKALSDAGIDLSGYVSRQLSPQMLSNASLVFVMTSTHLNILRQAGIKPDNIFVLGNGIPDPFGGDLNEYKKCLESIKVSIEDLVKKGIVK